MLSITMIQHKNVSSDKKYTNGDAMVMKRKSYDCAPGCPVEVALDVIGGRWKGVILYHIADGPLRFGELRRRLNTVTPRMLTRQLRELEADGLIVRTVYAEVPPHVDYALSEEGETLRPVIAALYAWGRERQARRKAAA